MFGDFFALSYVNLQANQKKRSFLAAQISVEFRNPKVMSPQGLLLLVSTGRDNTQEKNVSILQRPQDHRI